MPNAPPRKPEPPSQRCSKTPCSNIFPAASTKKSNPHPYASQPLEGAEYEKALTSTTALPYSILSKKKMLLFDVNVLLYAHRADTPHHTVVRPWLEARLARPEPFGYSDLVASSFLRIVTHPKVFSPPTPLQSAIHFLNTIRRRENCTLISPGNRHWEIFLELCRESGAKGNLIPDAWLAALAIESGCEWVSTDGDYARFPGLKRHNPLRSR
jgi:toxin-antitoxin system PIN domain toxin